MAKIIITIETEATEVLPRGDWEEPLLIGQILLDGDKLVSVIDEHGNSLIEDWSVFGN